MTDEELEHPDCRKNWLKVINDPTDPADALAAWHHRPHGLGRRLRYAGQYSSAKPWQGLPKFAPSKKEKIEQISSMPKD